MEQEIMSALFEDETQNDVNDEISSAWQPRPGCNPVDEKAVHDLLVWEEAWKKQVMERKEKIDEELSRSILPEPWPPIGQPNGRKRKHPMDNPKEPAIAVGNLLSWEEKWDQQYNTLSRNLYRDQ
ncbi:uncharacterized protein LOC117186816 [Drosophila miranda]|uniref:uncharacterized protein LOC117186816 n=1 Tax=Drosophila miranda TaxID=7229 RepID=UPI00143F3289|nr:uncharacterized protein LOC117186816 [Drosophila miranda]